jgi:uncharacterized membrane protein YdjX (TVP38/TMEM64 family)
VVCLFGAAAALVYRQIDIHAVHAQAARLPALAAFALLAVLPLLGFPVNILHVAAGMRFGAPLALVLVVATICLHLVASFFIVQRWRDRFERARWIARLRKRIPRGAHASVCVFTVLLPGAPYAAINYALPLLGVPLRTLLLCALPVHALRSTVTILFGAQIDKLTGARLAILLGYALAVLAASWWTYRRLQSRFEHPPQAADDRKRRA